MSKIKGKHAVLLFFFIYSLTTLVNAGFMGTDEYWTGITRYVPAQEKNLHNMLGSDDVKSPTQIMPLLGLSHFALQMGFEKPYEQYRFVQIFVGLFCTMLLGFCFFYFLPVEKHLFVFLCFTFYFAGPFAFTRPMYESLSAPWIVLSALSLQHYFKNLQLKWIFWSAVSVSIAFALRPQAGVCALALIGVLLAEKKWRALFLACAVGGVCFILAGIPDVYLREGFHSSLKSILFYNVAHGASYAQQPWYFYIPLFFLMMCGPFFLFSRTSELFKKFFYSHRIYWFYILSLVVLHSLFPQKWERFLIPILGLMILILADWVQYLYDQNFKKRLIGLAAFNIFLWIPSSFFPAQQNIIDLSLYLQAHPDITELIRYKNHPQWITEVFVQRQNWKWTETETVPTAPLSCTSRLVMNIKEYQDLKPDLTVEKIFETNLIEKAAYQMNPEKNLRRTPLVILKNKECL